MKHISTGEIFRDAVKRDTKLGREVSKYLQTRTMVPPEIAVRAVVERLNDKDVEDQDVFWTDFRELRNRSRDFWTRSMWRV